MDEVKLINGFLEHPVIDAVVKGLFAFDKEEMAKTRIESIRKDFQLFPDMKDENSGGNPLIIWIKGFDVADSEAKHGHVGNFAQIFVDGDGEKYTIRARKIWQEARFHPEKKRTTYKNPNKGYYVLKFAENKVVFPTKEAANEELMNMHEDFPETTLPNIDKLYISVFGKNAKGRAVLDKRILKIVSTKGGFKIISKADRVYPTKKTDKKNENLEKKKAKIKITYADSKSAKSAKSSPKASIEKSNKNDEKDTKGGFTKSENARKEKQQKRAENRNSNRDVKTSIENKPPEKKSDSSFTSTESERDAKRKKKTIKRNIKGAFMNKIDSKKS